MTFIEQSGLTITIIYIIATALALLTFTYRDLQLIFRNSIKYSNYSKKAIYFKLKPFEARIYGYRGLIIVGILLSLIYVFTDMVRIYLVILLPLILFVVFFYLQEQQIQKTNFNINKFDTYYEEIHTLIEKKAFLLQEIRKLNEKLAEKHKGFFGQIEAMNATLVDAIDRSYYLKLTNPIKLKIDSYQQDLTRFDNSISKKFNDLLKTYLTTHKLTKGLEVPALVSFSPKAIEDEINASEGVLAEKVLLDAEEWLLTNMKNVDSPVGLLRYLERYQKELTSHHKQAFAYYHQVSNRDPWFTYLEEKKLYHIKFLGTEEYFKKYPWIFQPKLYQNIKNDQALEIMQVLLKEDYYETSLTMLLTLPLAFRDLLPRATTQEPIANRTAKLMTIFMDVFSQPLEFYHPTTVLFDQAMALQHYFDAESTNPSSSNRIDSLVKENRIESEKDWIEKNYQEVFSKLTAHKNKAIQMLILLQDVVGADHPWFHFGSLVSLIHEYHKTCQEEKLNLLLVLIFLMISLQTQSDKIYDKAFQMVQNEIGILFKLPNKSIGSDVLITRIRESLKRDGYYQNVAAIVSRIEQERQVLDQILESKVA